MSDKMSALVEVCGSYDKKVAILSALWCLARMHDPVVHIAKEHTSPEVGVFYFAIPKEGCSYISMGVDGFRVESDGIHYYTWVKKKEDRKEGESPCKEQVLTLEEALQNSDFCDRLRQPWYTFGRSYESASIGAAISRIARELESVRATLESTLLNQIKDQLAAKKK